MQKVSKKLSYISLLIALVFSIIVTSCIPLTSYAAYNNEVSFNSDIVYMESLDQGTVIFNKNSKKKTAMASLTKITTAALVLDSIDDLEKKITVTQAEINEIAGTNSSTAGLVAGEVLTVRQLLNLLLVHSANEAAVILAHEVSGSTDAFVQKMNDFAKKLGCKNTHYKNPHGLDAVGHYTTAEDLAKIIKFALKNDTFKNIVSSPRYTLEATNKRETISYPNTNSLLISTSPYYYEPCKGIKTGTTEECGYALSSYAVKNGYTYLCIVIQGAEGYRKRNPNDGNSAFKETIKAYNWAFNNIKLKVVADSTDTVTVANVELGRKVDHVRLVPAEEATALIPAGVDASGISLEAIPETIPETVYAPVKAGDIIGKAKILYAGDVLTTVDLAAAEDVHLGLFATLGFGIKKLFSFLIFKIIFALAIIILLIYLLLNYLGIERRDNSKVHVVRINNDVSGRGGLRGGSAAHNAKSRQPRRKRSKQKSAPRKRKSKLKFKKRK